MMPLDWLLRRSLEVLRFLVVLGRRCPQRRPSYYSECCLQDGLVDCQVS